LPETEKETEDTLVGSFADVKVSADEYRLEGAFGKAAGGESKNEDIYQEFLRDEEENDDLWIEGALEPNEIDWEPENDEEEVAKIEESMP
jgi:hypothetical protein